MRGPVLACLALGLALTSEALAAPMGFGVEAAQVLDLDADLGHDVAAKTLTNALRQRILDSKEFTLNSESASLFSAAREAKCPLKHWARPVVAANDRAFDERCLRRIGERFRTRQFFWGFVYVEGPKTLVRLHFWQEGKGDRAATLPYDSAQPDRLADRLYKKLVTPTAVGDVALSGGGAGELFVDSHPLGAYADNAELTLETGLHDLELRRGDRVLARVRTRVEPGGRAEAKLAQVLEPAPPPASPPARPRDPPPVTVRPRPSAWPWVLGGASVAGLAGAGLFWALRSSERNDLEAACAGRDCLEGQRDAIERADLYGALSVVSFGASVAAGAGLATYVLTARHPPRVVGGVLPVASGAAAFVGGAF
ncbi:MAG TPA: hypothetical protein VFS43_33325 [Polyangiaceae bacterium]|nr:hypothetical protein [Polyangiaceae bacterium]